jgi:ribokinase
VTDAEPVSPLVAVVGAVPGVGADAAVAAARTGAEVHLVSATDSRDDVAALVAEGVDVGGVLLVEADGVAPVDHLGADHVRAVLGALPATTAVLVSTTIPAAAVAAAVGTAAGRGMRCVLDPDPVVPTVIGLLDLGAVLTPDADEVAELVRREAGPEADTSPAAAAATLHSWSGSPVVVTLGGEGVLLAVDGRVRRLPAHPVEVRDTAGAKSTFVGVLTTLLAAGEDVVDALPVATVAAGLATTAAGARDGMPTADVLWAAFDDA